MIKNNVVRDFLMPLAYSMFFTAAMTALLWLMTNYGALNFSMVTVGALTAIYSGLTLFGLLNLFKGNKLFAGSPQDVLSVSAQKSIHLAGVLAVIPALLFCASFAFVVKTFDGSADSISRVKTMEGFERMVFGTSKVWVYIYPSPPAVAMAPKKAPVIIEQHDVDFGPYMADVQRRIKRHWFPPKSDQSSKIKVRFSVNSEGGVSGVKLVRATNVETKDNAALQAVETSSPFRPLPEGAPPDVCIEFTFDYNVIRDVSEAPVLQGATNGTIGPVGPDQFSDAFSSVATYKNCKPVD